MLPQLVIEGGLGLALVRGAANAAVMSAFGACVASAWLVPPVLARSGSDAAAVSRRLRRVAALSLASAAALTVGWLLLQSAALGGSVTATPAVLGGTFFGRLLLGRLGLLALAGLALARHRSWAATALSGAGLAAQAGHGHAWAMWEGPSWLLLSSGVHLVAAGAWLGGLLPLLLIVSAVPPGAAATAAARFSPLGTACVILLAATAAFQGSVLIGTLPGLIGTGYGLVALAKLGGFLGLLAFAARNRFRLAPGLSGAMPGRAKRQLTSSIAQESVVGLLVVMAAGLMTSLPPSMHEQPYWPFPWRPSLETVQEDGDLMLEAVTAGGILLVATAAVGAGFVRRWRVRWGLAVAGAFAAWVAVPHLDLLAVEAYPTQFWRSPTGFSTASIVEGAALFSVHCAGCHGATGHGDGLAGSAQPAPPAELTAGHLWAHGDGELFWWLAHGIETPRSGLAMPGFAGVLTDDQRWALIDWVRANNAGVAWAATEAWPLPLQAPGLEAACAGRGVTLEDMRGQVVRIVFGPARSAPGLVTIRVMTDGPTGPEDGLCTANGEDVRQAYAVVLGVSADGLAGMEVLVDGARWLRAVHARGAAPSWDDPSVLAAVVRDLLAKPMASAVRGSWRDADVTEIGQAAIDREECPHLLKQNLRRPLDKESSRGIGA